MAAAGALAVLAITLVACSPSASPSDSLSTEAPMDSIPASEAPSE
jgi:hypothetical protein